MLGYRGDPIEKQPGPGLHTSRSGALDSLQKLACQWLGASSAFSSRFIKYHPSVDLVFLCLPEPTFACLTGLGLTPFANPPN